MDFGAGYRLGGGVSLLAALTMTQVRHGDSKPLARQAALDALAND